MKLTLDAAALGLTGQALADHLRQNGMECEYADPRYLVLMFTPENPAEDMARLEAALAELCARGIPPAEPPAEHGRRFVRWPGRRSPPDRAAGCVCPAGDHPAGSRWAGSALCPLCPARPPFPSWSAAR